MTMREIQITNLRVLLVVVASIVEHKFKVFDQFFLRDVGRRTDFGVDHRHIDRFRNDLKWKKGEGRVHGRYDR